MSQNLSSRPWAALTAITGIAALGITLAFAQLPAVTTAGACFENGAILKFELATTAAELQRLFHAAGDPCRPLALAAMDQSNHLDVFAYIPAYTAFTVFSVLFLAARVRAPLALAALAAALTALVADYVETTTLLTITKDLAAGEALMGRSSAAAWIKFGALAAHALLLAGVCLTQAPRRWILGVLLLLPAPAYMVMRLDPDRSALLNLAFFLSWTPLMLTALWTAVRPILRKAPSGG